MATEKSEVVKSEKSIVLPRDVDKAALLRQILYGAPGAVNLAVKSDGIRGTSKLSNDHATKARLAVLDGDDGTAMVFLLTGSGFTTSEKLDDFSFRKATDEASIATALANYGK